ncbi:MAG: abortive infection system antitoxin AbiGi family protein [Sulfobacillus sp.]|nr:abortive infection system antitoxin AbiGi family protein [Sulfobacillus sp.]
MAQRYFSNIYWHFVGRPANVPADVDEPIDYTADGRTLKSDRITTDIVEDILESGRLAATARDVVATPETRLVIGPFCSVTDIPWKDLEIHATYYGHTAIGFRPEVIYRQGWNPVWYIHPQLVRTLAPHAGARWLPWVKVTDFSPHAGHSFYHEREWRHLGDFPFDPATAVAAILVPQSRLAWAQKLVAAHRWTAISVVAWDLIRWS